jgi:hypothetical protein
MCDFFFFFFLNKKKIVKRAKGVAVEQFEADLWKEIDSTIPAGETKKSVMF